MLVYPIKDIVVSTEDLELTSIAQSCGVSVITRPEYLAQDETPTAAVVENLLERMGSDAEIYEAVSILQVTSPLRQPSDIRRSLEMINSGAYDSIISVYQLKAYHPSKMYFIDDSQDDSKAIPVSPHLQHARRQDLPNVFHRNGAIFIVKLDFFVKSGQLWGGRTGLVVMPEIRSIDIDSFSDLQRACIYLEQNQSTYNHNER